MERVGSHPMTEERIGGVLENTVGSANIVEQGDEGRAEERA